MCLLTGARRSEPTFLKWSEHLQADAVTFDAATMKAGREHSTPRGKLFTMHYPRRTTRTILGSAIGTMRTNGFLSGRHRLIWTRATTWTNGLRCGG
jgi:hypothetical protein